MNSLIIEWERATFYDSVGFESMRYMGTVNLLILILRNPFSHMTRVAVDLEILERNKTCERRFLVSERHAKTKVLVNK
jgi:hypothetical protein